MYCRALIKKENFHQNKFVKFLCWISVSFKFQSWCKNSINSTATCLKTKNTYRAQLQFHFEQWVALLTRHNKIYINDFLLPHIVVIVVQLLPRDKVSITTKKSATDWTKRLPHEVRFSDEKWMNFWQTRYENIFQQIYKTFARTRRRLFLTKFHWFSFSLHLVHFSCESCLKWGTSDCRFHSIHHHKKINMMKMMMMMRDGACLRETK